MKIFGLSWLGTSSNNLDGMTHLLSSTLGLDVQLEQEHARVFNFPDGTSFEIFKPADSAHDFFEHPVAGILVDDVREVRKHMEKAGIEFINEVHDGVENSWATAWSHFRAPDGYMYVLVSNPELAPAEHHRTFDELRLCLKVKDLDEAVNFYRDGLGLDIVDDWKHPGGERGVLFGVSHVAIELFDEAQWDLVDKSEVGALKDTDFALRVEAKNVAQLRDLESHLSSAGAIATGEVTDTPWEQTAQRMEIPGKHQLSIFVLPNEERIVRARARQRLRP